MITIKENGFHLKHFHTRPEELKNPYYKSDPNLLEIYEKSLPPPEAYLYFPKGEEIIVVNSLKPEKSLRRIFNNVPIYDFEEKLLIEFNALIQSHPENKLPDYWNDDINLRFIHATECDIKKSYERMIKYINWFHNMFPMEIQPGDKIYQLLNLGFLYVYGRDCHFRPIIVCQPAICIKYLKLFDEKEIIDASIFLFQFIVNNMLIPGQIENWIMIINMEGTSLLSLPDGLKEVIKALSEYFIARLYRCYILGLNIILRAIYKLVCAFLERTTIEKVIILDNKEDPRKNQDINPENIEQRFGGEAPDLIYEKGDCLFPPRMPNTTY